MQRDDAVKAISENVKDKYSKAEVLNLLRALEKDHESTVVEELRRGDVFWHKLVGGKIRPWIALSVRSELVVAVAMSSGDSAPRMIQAQCRYWQGSWVGTTTTLVNAEEAQKSVTRPYTNLDHLTEIEARIAGLYDLRTGVSS